MATAIQGKNELTWGELYPQLVRLMRSDNWTNTLYITIEWTLLALVIGGASWALSSWQAGDLSSQVFFPVALVAIGLIGALQHRLSGLGHEASHYSLFRSKLANDLVSDLLLMFPTFAITQQFRATHLDHHRFINDPERDPDAKRLKNGVPGAFPMPKPKFWLRYVVANLWLPDLILYIFGQGHNAGPFARSSKPLRHAYPLWLAILMLVGFWTITFAILHAVDGGTAFLLFWAVPLLTTYPVLMCLREIAHHSNAPDSGDLTNSRIFRMHPLVSWSVFPYGQDYHLTHHLFGVLPHHRIAQAHQLLLQYPQYRDHVVICRGYFFRRLGTQGPSVLDVLSNPRPTTGLPGLHIGRS